VERELMMTGIGGQGIQLAAQVLARAALSEGRDVQLFGSYGGMMRGGSTEATVVVADGAVASPPTVATTWSAMAMHHEHWGAVRRRLRPGSLVLVNSSVFPAIGNPGNPGDPGDPAADWASYVTLRLPVTTLALGSGGIQTATMVMLGAYAAVTAMVSPESLHAAVRASLPPYRSQHADRNIEALDTGFAAVARGTMPAWEPDTR